MKLPRSTPFVLLYLAATLFVVSFIFLAVSGISPPLALFWDILSSLDVNYQLLPSSAAANPLILAASMINAFVFALIAVALAALFFDLIKRINLRRRFMLSRIKRLRKHVIIVPSNNLSHYLSKELWAVGIENVIITERAADERSLYMQNLLTVVGDPKSTEAFSIAGIGRAKYVIACSDDDLQNAMITVTAKSASPRVKIMARVSDIDNLAKLGKAGAESMIMPEVAAGIEIGNELAKRFAGG